MLVAGGMVTISLPAEAAMVSLSRPATPASVQVGVLGIALGIGDFAAADQVPGQSQHQSPEGGQSQTQSRQSQTQRSPAPDRDDDDDAFFEEEAHVEVAEEAEEAPAEPEVIEEVIEIEVPEGSSVEYEIYEEGGVRVVRPRVVPPPAAPSPPPVTIAPAPAPVPAPPAPVAARPPRPTPTVEVSFHSSTHLEVQRFDPAARQWVNVCWAPCKARVPKDATLRIARSGDIPRSRPFSLPAERDRHALVIDAGSRRQRGAGIGIAALSSFGLVTGAVMIDATARFDDRSRRSYEGYVVLGMATLTFIAGVAMAASNRTKVREAPKGRRLALLPGGFAF